MTDIRDVILSILIMAGVFFFATMFYFSSITNYNTTPLSQDAIKMQTHANTTIVKINAVANDWNNTITKFKTDDIFGYIQAAAGVPGMLWGVLMTTFDMPAQMINMINDTVNIFGLPTEVMIFLWAILIIIIVFEIVRMIFK